MPDSRHVVLACGGRTYANEERIFAVLDELHARKPITLLVHGAARGADTLAGSWADMRGVACKACPANWMVFGRQAGSTRNGAMLIEHKPDLVVAFPGGPGTADMVVQARWNKVLVLEVKNAPC